LVADEITALKYFSLNIGAALYIKNQQIEIIKLNEHLSTALKIAKRLIDNKNKSLTVSNALARSSI
jgi:hypothetical protein